MSRVFKKRLYITLIRSVVIVYGAGTWSSLRKLDKKKIVQYRKGKSRGKFEDCAGGERRKRKTCGARVIISDSTSVVDEIRTRRPHSGLGKLVEAFERNKKKKTAFEQNPDGKRPLERSRTRREECRIIEMAGKSNE